MKQDICERLQSCCDNRARMLLSVSDERDRLRYENERLHNVIEQMIESAGAARECLICGRVKDADRNLEDILLAVRWPQNRA